MLGLKKPLLPTVKFQLLRDIFVVKQLKTAAEEKWFHFLNLLPFPFLFSPSRAPTKEDPASISCQ
jgi:hypothetical protein